MNVNIIKLSDDAIIPTYKTTGAAGADVYAIEDTLILPNEVALIKLGISIEVPEGFEAQIVPRSGLSLSTRLRVANSPGCIDSDYRGEVCVLLDNIDTVPIMVEKFDRIAQIKICPVIQAKFNVVDKLSDTLRGDGGFGSTGNNV